LEISKRLDPNNVKDIHRTLREAVLSTPIQFDDGKPVNIELIMSALTISPTGVTDSKRLIIPLTTAESLDVDEIWSKWVPKYLPESVYCALKNNKYFQFRLKLLLSTVAPIPRAVEYIVSDLVYYFSTSSDLVRLTSPEKLKHLFSNSTEKVNRLYKSIGNSNLSPAHMRAILFEEVIILDKELMSLVKDSLLTNSLDEIYEETKFVPKTSVVSMQIYSKNKTTEYCKTISATINNLLSNSTEKNLDIGIFLECAVAGLLRARLNVLGELAKKRKAETEVSHLLLLTDRSRVQGINDDLRLKLSSSMKVKKKDGPLRSVFLPMSYDYEDAFFTALNNTVIKPGDVVEFRTDRKECCDGLIFVYTSDGPLLLFHDEKSRKVPIAFNEVHPEISKTKFTMADMPNN
jgi:hypothetical protein